MDKERRLFAVLHYLRLNSKRMLNRKIQKHLKICRPSYLNISPGTHAHTVSLKNTPITILQRKNARNKRCNVQVLEERH